MADDNEQEQPAPIVLETFEGHPVIRTVTRIAKAGDGLSEAMQHAPQIIRYGERHRIIMDVESSAVTYRAAKGFEPGPHAPLERLVTLDAETVAILEPGASASIDQVLAHQRDLNEERREQERMAKTGQPRLPDDDDEAEAEGENGRASLRAVPDDGIPIDADGFADPALASEDAPL